MQEFPIIEKLGGRVAAVSKLKAAGLDSVDRNVLRTWVARGQMSSAGQRAAMLAADAEGIGYSADDFHLSENEAA